jgi:hypothetical protein
MDRTKASLTVLALLVMGLALGSGGKGCSVIGGPVKSVLVVHESGKDTPAVARVLTNLRDGDAATALSSRGLRVEIMDPDDKDANGQPVPLLEKFKPFAPPELLILAADDRLVKRSALPPTATEVVEAAK